MKKIAVLVGSLRKESINLVLARALEKLAAGTLEFTYVDLSALPHYNEDLWPDVPSSVTGLKASIEDSDGVLFVTPEYNRSVPGVLKDAIDWQSRPWGKNSLAGKPVAIAGTSPGAIGTAVAQSHLRTSLLALDAALLGQPEVYFQTKPGLIDENLAVTDQHVRGFLEGFLKRFDGWIDRVGSKAGQA